MRLEWVRVDKIRFVQVRLDNMLCGEEGRGELKRVWIIGVKNSEGENANRKEGNSKIVKQYDW